MNLRGWVVIAVVALVAGAVIWRPSGPVAQVPTEVGRVRAQGQVRRLVELYGVPAAVLVVAFWWLRSVELALAVGVVTWGCVAMWWAAREIRRSVTMVASLAGFTTVLAGQARTADTVEEAVRDAGPLVSGPVGEAAAELGETVSQRGIVAAAGTFVREVNVSAAEWLGMILVKASTGEEGGRTRCGSCGLRLCRRQGFYGSCGSRLRRGCRRRCSCWWRVLGRSAWRRGCIRTWVSGSRARGTGLCWRPR